MRGCAPKKVDMRAVVSSRDSIMTVGEWKPMRYDGATPGQDQPPWRGFPVLLGEQGALDDGARSRLADGDRQDSELAHILSQPPLPPWIPKQA